MPLRMDQDRAKRFVADKMDWIQQKLAYFSRRPSQKLSPIPSEAISGYRLMARELALARLEYFNREYGFVYKRITVRDQKTRWGSCSQKGNLNFNYKIALLPPELADYLIVHELCHLREMNHSPRFWALVAKTLPNFRERRRELRAIRLR